MSYTTPAQRITDLESVAFQGTQHMQRLTVDVTALREQGQLHNELLADAMKDLRDLRVDLADFKSEVKSGFAQVNADLAGLKTDVAGLKTDVAGLTAAMTQHTKYFEALFAHLGVQLPAAAELQTASN